MNIRKIAEIIENRLILTRLQPSHIRERLLQGILWVLAIVGGPALLVAAIEAVSFDQTSALVTYVALYLPVAVSAFFPKRIPYSIRSVVLLAALLILAGHNFLLWGLAGVAIPTLLVACVLGTMLLGFRGGLITLCVCIIPMIVTGTLMSTGMVAVIVDVRTMSEKPVSWVTAGLVVVLFGGVMVVASGFIQRNLLAALDEAKANADKLSQTIDQLNHRVELERLVGDISSRFVGMPAENVEDAIRDSFAELAVPFMAEYISIVMTEWPESIGPGYIEWNKPGANIANPPLSSSLRSAEWALTRLGGNDWADLAEGNFDESAPGYPSVLILSLRADKQRRGALIIATSTPGHSWPETDITILDLIANTYAHAIHAVRVEIESREVSRQLEHAQRLESVGRLAGGIAHDFNNLLMVIVGNTELALGNIRTDTHAIENINEIAVCADRAATLTAQLLAYSRAQTLQPKNILVNEVVSDVGRMLERIIGENIEVVLELSSDTGSICVDRGKLEQIIMNLATNAKDAMPEGGRLRIETRPVELNDEYCRYHPEATPGRYVLISVSDTGVGMAAEVLEKVFDPFFTTKEQGKGTGLGLASVYGTVRQSGGMINAYSEVGLGTTFSIYMPATSGIEELDSSSEKEDVSARGKETAFVVDDDASVRELLVKALLGYGYDVLQAGNGEEALAVIAQPESPDIDILITDLVMPSMGGRELASELEKIMPDVRVVYVSGYSESTLRENIVSNERTRLLQKPFSPAAIVRIVRELLDQE